MIHETCSHPFVRIRFLGNGTGGESIYGGTFAGKIDRIERRETF